MNSQCRLPWAFCVRTGQDYTASQIAEAGDRFLSARGLSVLNGFTLRGTCCPNFDEISTVEMEDQQLEVVKEVHVDGARSRTQFGRQSCKLESADDIDQPQSYAVL